MTLDEVPSSGGETGGTLLAGGRTTAGMVRIGNAVHRPVRPWTTTVHAVLRHLEQAGFEGAPRVVGFDDRGREVLTFLQGETVGDRLPWPEWVSSDVALHQVGSWSRRLHEATVDFVPPEDAVWFAGQTWRPGLVIGHHDAAPYNAVWRQGRLAGFVDWDTAGPVVARVRPGVLGAAVGAAARRRVCVAGRFPHDGGPRPAPAPAPGRLRLPQ